MASRPYTETEIRARETIKEMILAYPGLGSLDNNVANLLTEVVLAGLVNNGFEISDARDA